LSPVQRPSCTGKDASRALVAPSARPQQGVRSLGPGPEAGRPEVSLAWPSRDAQALGRL